MDLSRSVGQSLERVSVTPDNFKQLNKLMVLNFRLGLGPFFTGWIKDMGHIMVLTTIGRKSGLRRRTPVNYALMRGGVYCTAGFGQTADWFRNIQANPAVEVWIGNQAWQGRAEQVQAVNEWLPAYRQVLISSGFAAQAFEGIDPHTASNETLQEMGAHSPVVRITIERAVRGPQHPGDLIWVWPAAGAVLALLWWLNCCRPSK